MSTLAKSAILVTISEIIFNVTSFLVHIAVGRILDPIGYGRFGLVVTLTTMVIILIGNGIPTAMAKYISEIFETKPELVKIIKRQAIILQSILIGIITILFFLAAPLIAKILGDESLTRLFQISTLIIPTFAAASFYFSYYTGLHRFGTQSFLKISRSLFRVIFIISLAYFFRVEGSIVGYIIAPFSVFLLALAIDKFKISRELKKQESASSPFGRGCLVCGTEESSNLESQNHMDATISQSAFNWRKLVNYAWQIVIFFLAYELLISIDLYMVKGILRNDYLTGVYNASLTLGRLPYYLFYALTVILLPAVSKSTAENNQERTGKLINESLRLMLILLIPSIVLMNVFAGPLIHLFYGNNYADAAYPMSILVWGVGFLTVFYVMSFVMNGAGKVKIPMIIATIGFIINTILNYVLIGLYGLTGSAVATSITSGIITCIMLYCLNRSFQVKIKLKSLFKMILAGIVMFLTSWLFPKGEFIFILWSIILFGVYLLILYILGEIKKEDIAYLQKTAFHKNQSANSPD